MFLTFPTFSQDSLNQAMLKAVNELRASGCSCGSVRMRAVSPLKWNPKLESAARKHVKDMAGNNFLSHSGSDKSTAETRLSQAGYNWSAYGENIAMGAESVGEVMAMWKKSPGHCRNMMNPDFKEMGSAFKDNYWVQDFGKSI